MGTEGMNVALVGAGLIAESSHVPAWKKVEGADLLAIVETDADRASKVAKRWDIPVVHASYEEAISDRRIDALDICLPPHLHADCTVKALEAGKHVLLEKPFAATLDEARRILEAEGRSQATLMVAENWPYASATRQVTRLLTDGVLGEPFMLRGQHESALYLIEDSVSTPPWVLDSAAAAGGYVMNAGIHMIHLARELMGNFALVHSFTTAQPQAGARLLDYDAVVSGQFTSGALASFHLTGRSSHLGDRRLFLALVCTEGVVEFDMLHGDVAWTVGGTRTETVPAYPSLGFEEEITHFVDCCKTGMKPRTGARDQAVTLATVLAAYRSMEQGVPVSPSELLSVADLEHVDAPVPFSTPAAVTFPG